jgi:transcriptional regulator with PAS, ATPase and Fis domain
MKTFKNCLLQFSFFKFLTVKLINSLLNLIHGYSFHAQTGCATSATIALNIMDKEKELIEKALRKHKGKRKDAASDLGISERTLYRKLKEYDIEEYRNSV